jgi:acid phosphatase
MRCSLIAACLTLAAAIGGGFVQGAPGPFQLVFPSQALKDPHPDWDPLEHSSGIAPYHDAPGADIKAPKGCKVSAAAFLIRHSSIYANDDEWEDYMQPFVSRVEAARGSFPKDGPLGFLQDWQCPINDDNLEELTGPGEDDANTLGKRFRKLYPHLLPPRRLGKEKKPVEGEKVKTPFLVWTASSSRDIGTAKAFIRGAFPRRQEGGDGEGDGKYLKLVQVPNKDPKWSTSLTPHKVCPRFTKEEGRADARCVLERW